MIREKLSVDVIGKTRFYSGLAVGLVLAVSVYLFFAYFREILRFQTFRTDLIIPTRKEFLVYNLFFAAVSVTIGFGVTVWFWFHRTFSVKPIRKVNYISSYSMFWSMTLLYVVSKTGSFLSWIPFSLDRYDDHFNLSREFPLLLVLLPIVFFLNIWTPIRLFFRVGNWLLKSVAAFLVFTIFFAFATPINQKIVNNAWQKHMSKYNEIVDVEISRGKSKGVAISPAAIEIVRFNQTERVHEQARALKERFRSNTPIPSDSIILELILVKKSTLRNLKTDDWQHMSRTWPFALPIDIYRQLQISEDSISTKYLHELLDEYGVFFDKTWSSEEEEDLSIEYFNRSLIQRLYSGIHFQLQYVREKLANEDDTLSVTSQTSRASQ